MRINLHIWKTLAMTIMVLGLYAFSNHRNTSRKVSEVNIKFSENDGLFLSEHAVNKLLIHNFGVLKNMPKEKLALNTIEEAVEANKMVKSAEVFFTVDGELTLNINQRKPIGRVEGSSKYYLDEDGKSMPLSKSYSARVPIITGYTNERRLNDVYNILKFINTDDFLYKNIIGIHCTEGPNYQLKFRLDNFVVNLGKADNLDNKFKKFKAFYTKADKDKTLGEYAMVNLEYNKQVVCTKI